MKVILTEYDLKPESKDKDIEELRSSDFWTPRIVFYAATTVIIIKDEKYRVYKDNESRSSNG